MEGKYTASAILAFLSCIVISGCATYGDSLGKARDKVAKEKYESAIAPIKKPLSPEGDDRLLYHLELGTVKRLSGQYKESNSHFDSADQIASNLQTKRVSQLLQSMMTSPRSRPYAGRDFERAYINYYKALNYLDLAQNASSDSEKKDYLEKARIEIRRVSNVLNAIANEEGNYQNVKDNEKKLFTKLLDIFDKLRGNYLDEEWLEFRDDANARYLAGILYEKVGELDNARIHYQKAAKLYENGYAEQYGLGDSMTRQAWFDVVRLMRKAGGYGTEARRLEREKLSANERERIDKLANDGDAMGRLFVLKHIGFTAEPREMNLLVQAVPAQKSLKIQPVLTGTAEEQTAQQEWFTVLYADTGVLDMALNYHQGGLGEVVDSLNEKTIPLGPAWETAVDAGVIEAINGAGGIRVTVPYYMPTTAALDSVELRVDGETRKELDRADSLKTLAVQEQLLDAGRELKMGLARATLKNLTASEVGEAAGGDAGLIVEILGRITAAASSQAETRAWVTLPGEAQVGSVALNPGKHTVSVHGFRDGAEVVSTRREFEVDAGDVRVWNERLVTPEMSPNL